MSFKMNLYSMTCLHVCSLTCCLIYAPKVHLFIVNTGEIESEHGIINMFHAKSNIHQIKYTCMYMFNLYKTHYLFIHQHKESHAKRY